MQNASRHITTRYTDPVEQLSSAKTLTDSWDDVVLVDSRSFRSMVMYIRLTINDSLGVSLRLAGLTHGNDTVDYKYPLLSTEDTSTSIDYDEYTLKNDEDQDILLEVALIPSGYTKIQAKVATEGSTAATVNSLKLAVTK